MGQTIFSRIKARSGVKTEYRGKQKITINKRTNRRVYSSTITDEIKDNPERFIVGMDLKNVKDKESFKFELDTAKLGFNEKQKRGHKILVEKGSDELYKSEPIQEAIRQNVRSSSFKSSKSRKVIRGAKIDSISYLRLVEYQRRGKKISYLQRVSLETGRVLAREDKF